jgi:ATPase subunit of ABC transporter with duplicated ATPase domains
MLGKLNVEEIKPSNRRYPHIFIPQEREAGKDLLTIEDLSGEVDGALVFQHLNLTITKGEKVAFVGKSGLPAETLFRILCEDLTAKSGEFRWGVTTLRGYLPKDSSQFFQEKKTLIEWLRQYGRNNDERDENFLRGFLGKMLFSGEEATKLATVLSGGEKVRCMLSRLMMMRPNVLVLNEPTNHLDLESITALNNGLIDYKGTILFTSQDREFVNTIATRIVEITPKGVYDKVISYDEFLESPAITSERAKLY